MEMRGIKFAEAKIEVSRSMEEDRGPPPVIFDIQHKFDLMKWGT
jgi:hypothetical protein